MPRTALRDHAQAIWQAGVDAVAPDRLVSTAVSAVDGGLQIGGEFYSTEGVETLAVVGAGKASAGMALGLEQSLPDDLLKIASGWINVPEGVPHEPASIGVHAARPKGVNEPTSEVIRGTHAILRILSHLQPDDLAIVLISGGGSALLESPRESIGLADLRDITRRLSTAGASINELNLVRRHLSEVKRGGLARACGSDRLVTLIVSDVIGDPLDVIASGPTVPTSADPQTALEVLTRHDPTRQAPVSVYRLLEAWSSDPSRFEAASASEPKVNRHVIVGNNQTALDAAAAHASALGFDIRSHGSENVGEARQVGVSLLREAIELRDSGKLKQPVCLLSGGEPVVSFASQHVSGRGGRNQELVLAAMAETSAEEWNGIALLSAGTDGEDGPTDAAGGIADAEAVREAIASGLSADRHLANHDAYPYLEQAGALLRTGPTGTNVMDLRVVLIDAT